MVSQLPLARSFFLSPFICLVADQIIPSLDFVALYHRSAHIGDQPSVRKAPQAGANGPTPIPQALLDLERSLRRFVDALPPSATIMKVAGGIPPWNVYVCLLSSRRPCRSRRDLTRASLPLPSDLSSPVPAGQVSFGIEPTVFAINSVIYA